jgi:hypothetical protein
MVNEAEGARGADKPVPPPRPEQATTAEKSPEVRRHAEELLDTALEDTFPASDPTAITLDR